jgi:hypothetical protein
MLMSAPSGGDASRVLLAESTPTPEPPRTDTVIVLSLSAIDAMLEAEKLISDAHMWAENLTDLRADIGEAMDERTLEARRAIVVKMRTSFYENFARLIRMTSGFDGHELRFYRDEQACLYWRHTKSGYEGGLVFHRNLSYSKAGDPLGVGEWSVHT